MTITAKLADGTTLQFPDGTDPQVIQRTVKNRMAQSGAIVSPQATPQGQPSGPPVVATTPDGGKVYKMEDGSLSFANSDFSTNDQAQIASIMSGSTPAQVSTSGFDQATIAQNPVASRAAKVVQGVPFLGQWADEAVGAVSPQAGSAMRASSNAMDRENPVQSAALQIGGGILGTIPAVLAAGPAVIANAPTSLGMRALAGATTGGVVGATEGAVSGAGAAGAGGRLRGAVKGAALGGAFGGGIGATGPVVSKGIGAGSAVIRNFWNASDVLTIMKKFGISKKAALALRDDFAALDPATAQRNLDISGPNAIVADAGGATRDALDSAIVAGGAASEVGKAAVYGRASEAGARLNKVMDAVLGVPKGLLKSAKDIATRTAPARKAAYDAAHATPIDYSTGAPGSIVMNTLDRLDPKIVNGAVEKANMLMRDQGIKNQQIMATVANDGSVTYSNPPNVLQLDYIKRALGIMGRDVDTLGRPTFEAGMAGRQAKDLADAIKQATGGDTGTYAKALKLGGDKIQEDAALDMGRKLFTETKESVVSLMRNADVLVRSAAKQGVRENIDQVLSRVRRSADDPTVDIPETRRMLSMFSTPDFREKITVIMGKQKADTLLRELDTAGKHFGTMTAIAKGSQTAARTQRNDTLNALTGGNSIDSLMFLDPTKTLQTVARAVTGNTAAASVARKKAILTEVTRALTTLRGQDAKDALEAVQKAIAGQPVTDEAMALIGRTVSTALGVAGYQSGTRPRLGTTNVLQK